MTLTTAWPRKLALLIDEDRGVGRGILFRDADRIVTADVNLMAIHGRGLIGAVLGRGRAFALDLAPMRGAQPRLDRPSFLASVEATTCTETGISAEERAKTLRALGDWSSSPASFHSPGHVFPAVPAEQRVHWQLSDIAYHYCGHSVGALATAWCDVLDDRGEVASARFCRALAERLGLSVVTVGEALGVIDATGAGPVLRAA